MLKAIEVVNRYYDALNRRDWQAHAALIAPDCTFEAPGSEPQRGLEAIRRFDRIWEVATPDFKILPQRQIEAGSEVASENLFQGTHTGVLHTPGGDVPPTGRQANQRYVGLFSVREGRIVSQVIYFDQLEMMTQLGLMPPR